MARHIKVAGNDLQNLILCVIFIDDDDYILSVRVKETPENKALEVEYPPQTFVECAKIAYIMTENPVFCEPMR